MRPSLRQHRFPGSPQGAMAMFLIILASCLWAQSGQASKLQEQAVSHGKVSARRNQQSQQPEWRGLETTTGLFEPAITSARSTLAGAEQQPTSVNNDTRSQQQQQQQLDISSSSVAPEPGSTQAAAAAATTTTENSATTSASSSAANGSRHTTAIEPSSMSMLLDGMLMKSRPRADASGVAKSRGHKKSARQGEQAKSSRRVPPSGPLFVSPAAKGQRERTKTRQQQEAKQQEKALLAAASQKPAAAPDNSGQSGSGETTAQDNTVAPPGSDGISLVDGLDLMRNLLGPEQQQQQQSPMLNSPDDMVMSVMSSADGKERRLVMIARDTLDTLQRFAADEAKRQQQEQQQQQQQQVASNLIQPLTSTTTSTTTVDSSSMADQTSSMMNEGWSTVGTSSENPSTAGGSTPDTTVATQSTTTTTASTNQPLAGSRSNSDANASVDLGPNRDSAREVPVSSLLDQTSTTQSSTSGTSTGSSAGTSTTSASASTSTTTGATKSASAIDTGEKLTNGQQRVVAMNKQQQWSNQPAGNRSSSGGQKSAANRLGDSRPAPVAPAGKTSAPTKRKNNKSSSINKQTSAGGRSFANNKQVVGGGSAGSDRLTGNSRPGGANSLVVESGGSTAPPASSSAGQSPVVGNQSPFAGPAGSTTPGKRSHLGAQPVVKQTGGNQRSGAGSPARTRVAPDSDNSPQKPPFSSSRGDAGDASAGSEEPLGELDALRAAIPGEPLLDYPIYSAPPKSSFDCQSQSCPGGYYADLDSQCQTFHICQSDGRFDTFLCPNGTVFSQQHFVCVWWWQVDCQQSPSFYKLNDNIYCNSMGPPPSTSTTRQLQAASAIASEGGVPNLNELDASSGASGSQATRAAGSPGGSAEAMDSGFINRMLSMEPLAGVDNNDLGESSPSTTGATLAANSDGNLQQQHLELPSSQ